MSGMRSIFGTCFKAARGMMRATRGLSFDSMSADENLRLSSAMFRGEARDPLVRYLVVLGVHEDVALVDDHPPSNLGELAPKTRRGKN